MKHNRAGQFMIAFLVLILMLAVGREKLDTEEVCPMGMVYIPGGEFITGASEKEFLYLTKLCDMTVGGCYESWFRSEMPKRIEHVDSFCIDRYEFPNKNGRTPRGGMTWYDAQTACTGAGKRLCTEIEWERACSGLAEYEWSFGYFYKHGQCNSDSEALETSGAHEDCRSLDGAMDMNGNLAEWVADAHGDVSSVGEYERLRILKGGSYRDHAIFTRCGSVDLRAPEDRHVEFGARCCISEQTIEDEYMAPERRVREPRDQDVTIEIFSE